MSIWVMISAVAIAAVVGLVMYFVNKYGSKKAAVTRAALIGASAILSVMKSAFKDKPDEVDAHDFMNAFEVLSSAAVDAINEQGQGVPFTELKDNMCMRVSQIISSFPNLEEKISDDVIENAVNAFFMVIGMLPKEVSI